MQGRVLRLPRLNAILDIDATRAAGWTVPDLARAFLGGGARFIQVRAKQSNSRDFLAACDQVVDAARGLNAIIIINDRADIARLAAANGVHVGQDDLPASAARRVLGPDSIIGLSTHTAAQVTGALREPIDYIAVGPVFGTSSKATGYDAVGLDFVAQAVRQANAAAGPPSHAPRPIVAIGGIRLARARSVIDAGAASVAVISDLLATGNPEARVREYLQVLGE